MKMPLSVMRDVENGSAIGEQDIASRFSKAANAYDHHARIQYNIATSALNNLPQTLTGTLLDIGCATGVHSYTLYKRGAKVTGIDIAQGMLEEAQKRYPQVTFIQGNAQSLPLKQHSIDIVFSSMALQWCSNPLLVASEIQRVLKPSGMAEISIMVAGSFSELHRARKLAHLPPAITPMPHADAWTKAFLSAHLRVSRLTHQCYVDKHTDIMSLLRSIKNVGAGATGQKQPPLSRSDINKLAMAYKNIGDVDELLPLTYQVCHFRLEKL